MSVENTETETGKSEPNEDDSRSVKTASDDRFEDEQIVHCPQTCEFSIGAGFDYLRRDPLYMSEYLTARSFMHIPFAVYNRMMYGLEVKGAENREPCLTGGAVIVCNHVNYLDCVFIDSLFPYSRVYFTTLESNFRIPVARHLVRFFGGVPIPREVHNFIRFTRAMKEAVQDGACVVFYPEGVLYPYYEGVRRFHLGAFELAAETGVPVIPLAISYRRPDGIFALYKRKPCATVTVLSPLYPAGSGSRRRDAEALRDACSSSMSAAIAAEARPAGVGDLQMM